MAKIAKTPGTYLYPLPPCLSGGPRDLDRKPGALSGTLRDAPHAALRWGSEAK